MSWETTLRLPRLELWLFATQVVLYIPRPWVKMLTAARAAVQSDALKTRAGGVWTVYSMNWANMLAMGGEGGEGEGGGDGGGLGGGGDGGGLGGGGDGGGLGGGGDGGGLGGGEGGGLGGGDGGGLGVGGDGDGLGGDGVTA